MNPAKVDRNRLTRLEDLPNVGPAMAKDLLLLGIHTPADLIAQDPLMLYSRLGEITRITAGSSLQN
ncbi:MAG: helix-hairpin-helix domain-containing protein [Desulfuromonadaceae bacterium]|nr:helix-hairpin-helix domain-containing protein [Desulfuromonadaceae bacterium]